MTALDPRLGSIAVVAAISIYLLALRTTAAGAAADDTLGMLAVIDIDVDAPGGAARVALPVPASIGRSATASLVLSDPQVSRLHARIEAGPDGPVIRDLGSRNGTWVNARPIEAPHRLAAGDRIEMGATTLRVAGLSPGERNPSAGRKDVSSKRTGAVPRRWT